MKIVFPDWVYRTLEKYGDVALPYNKYTIVQLRDHFNNKMKRPVYFRRAKFVTSCSDGQKMEKEYFVAYTKERKYEG